MKRLFDTLATRSDNNPHRHAPTTSMTVGAEPAEEPRTLSRIADTVRDNFFGLDRILSGVSRVTSAFADATGGIMATSTLTLEHERTSGSAQQAVLIAALAAGVVAQGGYYLAGRLLRTGLVAVAVILAIRDKLRATWTLPLAGAGLAGWILLRGVTGGGVELAAAAVATLGVFTAAAVVAGGSGPAARERYAEAAIWIGVLVAVTAWFGVAWRSPRFAVLVEHKLWRGASTLTYPNAAAALLAPLALLALALFLARPGDLKRAAAAYLLLVGVGAALSRAGFLALGAGLAVLTLARTGRRARDEARAGAGRILRALPIALGAAVAVGALAPSFPASAQPRPYLAVAGLLAGAVVAVGLSRLLAWSAPAGVAGTLAAAAIAGPVAWVQHGAPYLQKILESRGNLDSSGRSEAWTSAFALIARNPLTGTGIGQARFFVTGPGGRDAVSLYAHDEYLQTLVDLGAIGAVLLVILLATVALTVRRRGGDVWAGALAALTAFAVHSGLDFLWHIAVLPLLAGLLVGLAATGRSEEPTNAPSRKEQQR